LGQRKHRLSELLSSTDPLRDTTHREKDGGVYWKQACSKGWEGANAKRADGFAPARRKGGQDKTPSQVVREHATR
jgi:bifunctional non-homologous end joining protein LigD